MTSKCFEKITKINISKKVTKIFFENLYSAKKLLISEKTIFLDTSPHFWEYTKITKNILFRNQ